MTKIILLVNDPIKQESVEMPMDVDLKNPVFDAFMETLRNLHFVAGETNQTKEQFRKNRMMVVK